MIRDENSKPDNVVGRGVNMFAKRLALGIAIFGPVALLWLAAVYRILSPREVAVGMIAWFVALFVAAILRKLATSKGGPSGGQSGFTLDERTRKRVLRGIWIEKAWIILLAVSLPAGIAIGVANHAWLPTLGGVGINLFLMYAAIKGIRQRQKRLV
jgi:hypothetical protein